MCLLSFDPYRAAARVSLTILGFLLYAPQMLRSPETLRVNLVISSFPTDRAQPAALPTTFNPPMGAPLPGAVRMPGSSRARSGTNLLRRESRTVLLRVAGAPRDRIRLRFARQLA